MNIRFSLLILSFSTSFSVVAQFPSYTPKQKAILLLKSITQPVWHSTAPHHTIDPLLRSHALTNALPGLPAKAEFFFTRTPEVTSVQNYINPDAFENTLLQPFVEYGNAVKLQQHTSGIHIGQLWNQDNLEMSWQWWIGAQERNWWLRQPLRSNYQKTLASFDGALTKEGGSVHAPQEPEHRLTLWHATRTTIGIGDIHLQLRYRAHPTNWFSCSIGGYAIAPVGTTAGRTTPDNSDETLPITTDELPLRIINRMRDVMLCAPLGNNSHLGIGLQTDAQCFITRYISLRAAYTRIYYRGGIESRYALATTEDTLSLEEGLPGSSEGVSPHETVIAALKKHLYPSEIKVYIQPGGVKTASFGIHYEDVPLHLAMIYGYESVGSEYSESAPLATLTRTATTNHIISALAGWRTNYHWGQSSFYVNAHYITSGTHAGGWGCGIGTTIQA